MKRHIILVGLPGVGKTTVGRLVAEKLGAPFVDLDGVIEQQAGKTVARLFQEDGEPAFRELEQGALSGILSSEPCVTAPGGGWAAERGNLESVAGRAMLVYLEAPPEIAAERVAGSPLARPLLGGDRLRRMQELLQAREPFYRRCDVTVDAARGDVAMVAEEVAKLARSRAGWY